MAPPRPPQLVLDEPRRAGRPPPLLVEFAPQIDAQLGGEHFGANPYRGTQRRPRRAEQRPQILVAKVADASCCTQRFLEVSRRRCARIALPQMLLIGGAGGHSPNAIE